MTYLRVEEVELARATFTELQVQHTEHHHGKQARIYLKYIYDTFGAADPSRTRPDRSPPTPPSPPSPKNEKDPAHPGKVAPAPEGSGAPAKGEGKGNGNGNGNGGTEPPAKGKAAEPVKPASTPT